MFHQTMSMRNVIPYCTFLFLHKLNVLNKIVMNCCNLKGGGTRLIRKLEKPKKKRGEKKKENRKFCLTSQKLWED